MKEKFQKNTKSCVGAGLVSAHQKRHNSKGITLIALVITIIVMLILVAVTITISLNGGLFDYAGKAAHDTESKKQEEQDYANPAANMTTEELIDKYTTYGVTYPSYEIGDTVTIGTESFYVIEDSNEKTSTVKLLAALNVDTTTNKQSASAGDVAFDSTDPYTNDYNNSDDQPTIKGLVDSYVDKLEESASVTLQEGRLMLKDEANALESGNTDFIYDTNFWLGSLYETDASTAWSMLGGRALSRGLHHYSVNNDDKYGLRPVIVISKTNIPSTSPTE